MLCRFEIRNLSWRTILFPSPYLHSVKLNSTVFDEYRGIWRTAGMQLLLSKSTCFVCSLLTLTLYGLSVNGTWDKTGNLLQIWTIVNFCTFFRILNSGNVGSKSYSNCGNTTEKWRHSGSVELYDLNLTFWHSKTDCSERNGAL